MGKQRHVDWAKAVAQATSAHRPQIAKSLEEAVNRSIEELLGNIAMQSIDPVELERIVEDLVESRIFEVENRLMKELKEVSLKTPRPIEVKLPDGAKRKVDGIFHENFDHLLKMVGAKLNVALIGEAGSGKTHATEQVADVLGVPYWPMSFHSKMTATDLRGYCDANGKYNASALYLAMKQGGVLCLDEFDRSNTEVTVSLNNVLASGKYLFPNGELVTKHPDFVVVACQNTTGTGTGSKLYAAAQRQDASTLNRFVKLEWNVDENMERSVCGDTEATREVQRIRKKSRDLGMDLVISPRQSIHANTLVSIGYKLADAIHYSVYECLAADQIERLKQK